MKKFITLLFVASSTLACAQIALKLSNVRPTGNMGATLKPSIGIELMYKGFKDDDDESGFHPRASISFSKFKTRLDTFPTFGVISSNGTTVTPGYTVIHKYSLAGLSVGGDIMIRLTDEFYLYPGFDVGALFSSVEYDSYAPLISSEGYSGGYVYLSMRLRAGAEYLIKENIGIFLEANRSMNFSPEAGGLAYNDYGVGVRYKF
ncbi:MAG: hypothetical protein JNL60_04295 [Bacteroidia bacterium]|nr:hypothetical protein [Bacteroidia bacterium]